MKLRLRKNSIRLRLTKGEVAEFLENGRVDEEIVFGPGKRFRYRLQRDGASESVQADLGDDEIRISVPDGLGIAWASSEQVGMDGSVSLGDLGELNILIEKDFACLEPRAGGEDEDTFPNPLKCGSPDGKILDHPA